MVGSSSGRFKNPGLKKELTLFDVYAICTGAMFSSGFFLLPGIAFAQTGRSVMLAYLLSGVLILPAMLSKAELSTAMPRVGGTYFYLDRSFGPMVGTVGGLGTWVAMVLKTAFAFIGIGAYLGLVLHFDSTALALCLTGFFLILNVAGAKEASWVQRMLVAVLVGILTLFVIQGLCVPSVEPATRTPPTPYLKDGLAGLLSTIGLVFVSYAGLTKVASVAEEVQDPDRNIPLGMVLSLISATAIYGLGTYVLIEVLDPIQFARPDLTPIASAAGAVFDWMPSGLALGLIIVAAIAAFASTGNAGILAGSRYLLALALDRRIPAGFARIGRFRTPTLSVLATAVAIVLCIVTFDVTQVAKLASAFQLLIFALVNLAVIIMRESRIDSYDPGFRSPFYPWIQMAGFVIPFLLIAEMGHVAILFTFGTVTACLIWYGSYARPRICVTGGAIDHVFARLARRHAQSSGSDLDLELRTILQEKGLRKRDPYDEVVARAFVLDVEPTLGYRKVASQAAELIASRVSVDAKRIADGLLADNPFGLFPAQTGVALPHVRLEEIDQAELVLVRCRQGLSVGGPGLADDVSDRARYHAIVFLVSPERHPRIHLRVLAYIALCLERDEFLADWLAAESPQALRETLLRHERFLSLRLAPGLNSASMIGRRVRDLDLPEGSLLAAIRRGDGHVIFPRGNVRLMEGDQITIVGAAIDVQTLHKRFSGTAGP
ncbi:MAG: amino acid permease [Planctomycetota bacterium]